MEKDVTVTVEAMVVVNIVVEITKGKRTGSVIAFGSLFLLYMCIH